MNVSVKIIKLKIYNYHIIIDRLFIILFKIDEKLELIIK